MAKIETTTHKFKAGVRLTGPKDEIRWESTGHLSVRLLDASASLPIAGASVIVTIPKEGAVTLESDDRGYLFRADVPYQDYELDIAGVKVYVPAVGERSEIHERHVPARRAAFVHAILRHVSGPTIVRATVTVTFPSGTMIDAKTDGNGVLLCQAIDGGEGEATLETPVGAGRCPVAGSAQIVTIVTVEETT